MPSKSNLALGLKAAIIVAAVLVVFHQDLAIVASDALQNDFTSYVLAIPFLFAYLTYRKRKMLRAVMPLETSGRPQVIKHSATIAGVLLSTTAILLYWRSSYTFTPLEYHMLTLPIFAAGLTLILFNAQTLRQLAFPLAFLTFLTPPPSEILYALGSTLSTISSEVSYTIVHSLGIPSTLTTEYGNPVIQVTRSSGATMSFAVDIACSGIYSLIGFLIFAFFIAYIIRDKPWKKLALFLIGISLIYILNIIRITTILLIGYNYGEELALQLFHLLGGWTLIFLGTLLLLAFSEKILRAQIFAKPAQKCSGCNPNAKANQNFCLTCGRILKPASIRFHKIDIIKIAAITVSVILLISIQVPVFALTEGPAQIIIQTPTGEQGNTQLLPQIQGYNLAFEYRDTEFEEVSRQDASLVYAYMPLDKNKEPVWVTVEIGSSTAMLHRWEACLITWVISHQRPAVVIQLDLKDVQILENPPIIARYFAFRVIKTNQTQVVLYWYETSIFVANNSTQQKRVKISLITYPETPQNITKAEDLLPFATTIAQHWQPIKTWTQIALFLSQESIYPAAITSALLPTIIVLYALENRKQGKANAKAYQKLSTHNKQIIDLITETKKTASPTLQAIASALNNQTAEAEEKERLLQKLSQLEQTGIVSSDIANIQDEPTHVWKANMSTGKKAKTQGTKLPLYGT
jgi:exosortase